MAKITNLQLIEACKKLAGVANPVEKTWSNGIKGHKDRYGYVYGAKGEMCTQALLEKFAKSRPGGYEPSYFLVRCKPWIGRPVTDCSGMIRNGIRTVDTSHSGTNSTNYYNSCTKKGPISTIPEVPGICVWKAGHIGLYLGNGMVVESRGADYGIVFSPIKTQPWTNWGYLSAVNYGAVAPAQPEKSKDVEVVVTGASVNVRDTAAASGKIVKTAHKGDKFSLLGIEQVSGWYQIGVGQFISNRADLTKLV